MAAAEARVASAVEAVEPGEGRSASDRLKVLFFCGERSPWGIAHLQPLLDHPRLEVAAVVMATPARWSRFREALTGVAERTSSPKRWWRRLRSRSHENSLPRLIERIEACGVPLVFCDDVNRPEAIASFADFGADLVFSAAYPQIFAPELLGQLGPKIYNSHPSLLPKFRGAHPVFWAVATGAEQSGGTIHVMTAGLDKGAVVARTEPVPIAEEDGYRELYGNLVQRVPGLIDSFVDHVRDPDSEAEPQDDAAATYFRSDRDLHCRLFWSEFDAEELHHRVRACDSRAYFFVGERRVRVLQSAWSATNRNMTNGLQVPAGTVVDLVDGQPVIAARGGFLHLKRLLRTSLLRPRFQVGQTLS